MEKCRICSVANVRMHVVTDRNLQEVYEKLTNIPFVTEDRKPMLTCFICYTKLKQCWQLQRTCLKAEEVFAQNEDFKENCLTNEGQLKSNVEFSKSPIELISIVKMSEVESVAIKEELPDICDTQHDIEIKEELLTEEPEDGSEQEDIPPHSYESGLEYEEPLLKFEVEEEREVPEKKVKCVHLYDHNYSKEADIKEVAENPFIVKGALAVIKQETQIKLEDTITDMQETNRHLNVNMICTTNNNTHKSVSKYKEPITDTQQETYRTINNELNIPIDSKENFRWKMWHNERDSSDTNRYQSEEKPFNGNIRDINENNIETGNITNINNVLNKKCRKNSNKDHLTCKVMTKRDDIGQPYSRKKYQFSFTVKDNYLELKTGVTLYKCDVCQKAFSLQSTLIRHLLVHTSGKPFKCDICQKCFTGKYSLKRHSHIHTGEKPYKCDVCQKGYTDKRCLLRHSGIHTGVKP